MFFFIFAEALSFHLCIFMVRTFLIISKFPPPPLEAKEIINFLHIYSDNQYRKSIIISFDVF